MNQIKKSPFAIQLLKRGTVLNNQGKEEELFDRDHILVKKTLSGNLSAFNEIFDRHHKIVAATIFKIVRNYTITQDLTQETFITAYEKLKQYKNNGKFKPWLMRIARNVALQKLRKDHAVKNLENKTENIDEVIGIMSNTPSPLAILQQKEFTIDFKQALSEISNESAEVLTMAVLDKMPYKAIADNLGISLVNVKIIIYRARKKILKKLSTHFEEKQ